jgi:hypothetical protein
MLSKLHNYTFALLNVPAAHLPVCRPVWQRESAEDMRQRFHFKGIFL